MSVLVFDQGGEWNLSADLSEGTLATRSLEIARRAARSASSSVAGDLRLNVNRWISLETIGGSFGAVFYSAPPPSNFGREVGISGRLFISVETGVFAGSGRSGFGGVW